MGWQRDGFNIAYYANSKKRKLNAQGSFGNTQNNSAAATTASSGKNI